MALVSQYIDLAATGAHLLRVDTATHALGRFCLLRGAAQRQGSPNTLSYAAPLCCNVFGEPCCNVFGKPCQMCLVNPARYFDVKRTQNRETVARRTGSSDSHARSILLSARQPGVVVVSLTDSSSNTSVFLLCFCSCRCGSCWTGFTSIAKTRAKSRATVR